MLADLVGVDGFRINIEVISNPSAKTGGIEDGAGADDFFAWEARELVGVVG